MQGLVEDLLDYARIDAGTFNLRLEHADLGDSIRAITTSLRPQVAEAQLSLEIDLQNEALPLDMDPARIERVLTNLITNAIKFTPKGGSIRVRALRNSGDYLCEVEDTGIGIAREDIPRLFHRFGQLRTGLAQREGMGLGLAISKALVEAHGGGIGVRSVPGKGSTFWFSLPIRQPEGKVIEETPNDGLRDNHDGHVAGDDGSEKV